MAEHRSSVLADGQDLRDSVTAQRYFQIGREAEQAGDRWKAIDSYEAAFTADPDNPEICFRLAYSLDLAGEEDEAIHLYEQAVQQAQPRFNALLNLAVLYEDRGQYAQAERCVRQVLATDPNHLRARLYLKDVLDSRSMLVDEEEDDGVQKTQASMDTPVTDFDLTVRTRNALRKMSIRTLGDLLRITEAELRSYRNLGEASIEEVKAMLAQHGLALGAAVEQQQSAAKQAVYDQLKAETGSDEAMLGRSVNDLNLSVRARKALALLNVGTVGDVCMKTEAELMGIKNFGMTSLMEIKAKLSELGLSLRTLEG